MVDVVVLGLIDIVEHNPCCSDPDWGILHTEAFEGNRLEMLGQLFPGTLGVKRPIIHREIVKSIAQLVHQDPFLLFRNEYFSRF